MSRPARRSKSASRTENLARSGSGVATLPRRVVGAAFFRICNFPVSSNTSAAKKQHSDEFFALPGGPPAVPSPRTNAHPSRSIHEPFTHDQTAEGGIRPGPRRHGEPPATFGHDRPSRPFARAHPARASEQNTGARAAHVPRVTNAPAPIQARRRRHESAPPRTPRADRLCRDRPGARCRVAGPHRRQRHGLRGTRLGTLLGRWKNLRLRNDFPLPPGPSRRGDLHGRGRSLHRNRRPLRSGAEGLPAALICPSGGCRIRPAGTLALDLTGLSHITVEGFVFEGKVVAWANGSEGNHLRRIEIRPRPGGPYPEINAGCGRDNTLESFVVEAPRDTNVTPLAIGVNCTAPPRDSRSTFRNGFVRGGRNAVSLAFCDDCVLDGLTVLGAWNHTFSIDGDVTNLTVRNSVFLASTLFREGIPDSREIHGLTFVNNAVVSGSVFPGYSVPSVADGRIVIRNNVFYNMGHNTAESMLDIFDDGTVDWDIGSNAYVGGGNFNDRTPFWRDGRDGTKRDFFPDYDNDGALGSSTAGLNFTDWQARGSNPDGSAWDTG